MEKVLKSVRDGSTKNEKWAIKSARWKDNKAETPGILSKCHCHLPRPRQTFYVRD